MDLIIRRHGKPMLVAILEDEPIMLDRLSTIIEGWDRATDVIGFASNEAFSGYLADGNRVDILLADLKLPDGSGCDSILLLSTLQPESLSMAISALSDGDSVSKAIMAGAIGYMHKDDTSRGVVSMLEDALKGMSPMSPSVANVLFQVIRESTKIEPRSDKKIPVLAHNLTPREVEVLQSIAKGYSYNETAKILGLSRNTVPVHIRHIYKKLQSNNKLQAVHAGRRLGIL